MPFFHYRLLLVGLITIVLWLSWEQQQGQLVLAHNPVIPEESIRLRILAHSDRPYDQLLKRNIRDAIAAQMKDWTAPPDNLDMARDIVKSSLPDLENIVQEQLDRHGVGLGFKVEYGKVDFPVKRYSGQVYPEGLYEGVKVTLGSGQGGNWWCVLFPPLCFVEVGSGKAVASQTFDADANVGVDTDSNAEGPPEVRFFLVELFDKIMKWFGSLFA